MFVIPVKILKDIEKLIRGFLWCHGDMKRGMAKVKWNVVCLPKEQGGLGLKSLRVWNTALMAKHVWNIVTKKKSIWVSWVYLHHIKNRSFWDLKVPCNCSWSWRKVLQCRGVIRRFLINKVGNGESTSAWYDNWHPAGLLCDWISHRDVYGSIHNDQTSVKDLITENGWNVDSDWKQKFPLLFDQPPPQLVNGTDDIVLWKSNNGRENMFSVSQAWNDLKQSAEVIRWAKMVWFSQNIPRHAFVLWLALSEKLKTKDKLRSVEDPIDMCCVLCKDDLESHNHLFFTCSYSAAIWGVLKPMGQFSNTTMHLRGIKDYMENMPMGKAIWSIIKRLIVAAAVYYIWQERNLRIFQDKERSHEEVCDLIIKNVRYRLMGLKLKSSSNVMNASRVWSLGCDDDKCRCG